MKSRRRAKLDLSGMKLPTEKKKPARDIRRYSILLYGKEKIGKTTLMTSFPDILFLTTEPGTKDKRIFEIDVSSWDVLLKTIELLEREPKRFKNAVIDTVDELWYMCQDYVCKQRNIAEPGVDEQGRNDRGRSWNAIAREFRVGIQRLRRVGLGVHFVSHARSMIVDAADGDETTIMDVSISGGGARAVKALADYIWFCDYMRDKEGDVVRVVVTQGDDNLVAGSRGSEDDDIPEMPKYLPLLKTGGYDLIKAAFNGKHPGIDPATLQPSTTTSKAVAAAARRDRVRNVRGKLKASKRKGGMPRRK